MQAEGIVEVMPTLSEKARGKLPEIRVQQADDRPFSSFDWAKNSEQRPASYDFPLDPALRGLGQGAPSR